MSHVGDMHPSNYSDQLPLYLELGCHADGETPAWNLVTNANANITQVHASQESQGVPEVWDINLVYVAPIGSFVCSSDPIPARTVEPD